MAIALARIAKSTSILEDHIQCDMSYHNAACTLVSRSINANGMHMAVCKRISKVSQVERCLFHTQTHHPRLEQQQVKQTRACHFWSVRRRQSNCKSNANGITFSKNCIASTVCHAYKLKNYYSLHKLWARCSENKSNSICVSINFKLNPVCFQCLALKKRQQNQNILTIILLLQTLRHVYGTQYSLPQLVLIHFLAESFFSQSIFQSLVRNWK